MILIPTSVHYFISRDFLSKNSPISNNSFIVFLEEIAVTENCNLPDKGHQHGNQLEDEPGSQEGRYRRQTNGAAIQKDGGNLNGTEFFF